MSIKANRLMTPASPHVAAEVDVVAIDPEAPALPECDPAAVREVGWRIVRTVDTQRHCINVIARWHAPLVLYARLVLGTINHRPLAIVALRTLQYCAFRCRLHRRRKCQTERIN